MKIAAITYTVLIFAALLSGLIILYRLLIRCFRFFSSLSGVQARFVVIALGIASVFFPTVLPYTFKSLLWFGLDASGRLPDAFRTGWYQAIKDCSGPEVQPDQALPPRCIVELGLRYLSSFTTTIKTTYQESSVYRIPLDQLIYLGALWVGISLCFRQVPVSTAEGGGPEQNKPWLGLAYGRLSPSSKKNIFFFVILALAAYLSIAAITAIPALLDKGAPVEQITLDLTSRLDHDFEEQKKHLAEIAADPRTSDPFEPLRQKLTAKHSEVGNSGGDQTASDSLRDTISRAEEALNSEASRREYIFKQWKGLLAEAEPRATSDKVHALNAFQLANSGRVGIRETNQHSLNLEAWYRNRINEVNSDLRRCRNAVVDLDGAWDPWVQAQLRYLDSAKQTRDIYVNYYPLPDDWVRYATRECNYKEDEYELPTRATLGSLLGPFGLVARWLVETESIHLALITGLLGFGLLGSACSTFIREQFHRKQDEPLVSNLASVVIRGSSAAIVVFLAVEGGLGIFSGSTAEPNPYVLLFTCLVASVFSENVWTWAEKKLKDELGKDSQLQRDSKPETDQKDRQGEKLKEQEKLGEVVREEEQSAKPDERASDGGGEGNHGHPEKP